MRERQELFKKESEEPLLPAAMSRLRAPGAVGPRAIRPPSGLIRPPLTAGMGPGPTKSHVAPQARPPAQTPPNRTPSTQANSFPYQIGDSVLVGGEKPGKVAFIGPTQFAQGVWAGIILDTPDGKNDGAVKGVAYFKCPPNYGLFAKLDKLSPLPQQQKPHPSQASESGEPEFNLGDRVIADGGKKGTVSFMGPTQFAKGTWIGVSLDAPEGKNDGKVGGVQYFTCPPNHGLFTRPIKLILDTAATPTNQSSRSSGGLTPADPSELKKKAESLRIGDRVLVNNSKEGTLRFLGSTHFAKGIWVGVELDDAQGKNDGAVSGKRCVSSTCTYTVRSSGSLGDFWSPIFSLDLLKSPTCSAFSSFLHNLCCLAIALSMTYCIIIIIIILNCLCTVHMHML